LPLLWGPLLWELPGGGWPGSCRCGRRGHSHHSFRLCCDVVSHDSGRHGWLHLLSVWLDLVSARLSREPSDVRGRQSTQIIIAEGSECGERRITVMRGVVV